MPNTEKLKITYRQVEDLIPYANNARTHSEEQIARIVGSIKEFGWTNPILLDGNNGILAGHGRVMAAQKLGLDTVPTIELAGMSEAQRRAYILADNKLALDAGWDEDLLVAELQALEDLDYDLELTGFSDDEVRKLLSGWDSAPHKDGGQSSEQEEPIRYDKRADGQRWMTAIHCLLKPKPGKELERVNREE